MMATGRDEHGSQQEHDEQTAEKHHPFPPSVKLQAAELKGVCAAMVDSQPPSANHANNPWPDESVIGVIRKRRGHEHDG
jgi:hypothetical protein